MCACSVSLPYLSCGILWFLFPYVRMLNLYTLPELRYPQISDPYVRMLSLYTLPELFSSGSCFWMCACSVSAPYLSWGILWFLFPYVRMLNLYTLPELWYPLVLVSECAHAQCLHFTWTVVPSGSCFRMCACLVSTLYLNFYPLVLVSECAHAQSLHFTWTVVSSGSCFRMCACSVSTPYLSCGILWFLFPYVRMLNLYTLPELWYPQIPDPFVCMLSLYTLSELWYPLVLVSQCAHAQSLHLTWTLVSSFLRMLSLYTLPDVVSSGSCFPICAYSVSTPYLNNGIVWFLFPNVSMLNLYNLPELWYPLNLVSQCAHAQFLHLTWTVVSSGSCFRMCACSVSTSADLTAIYSVTVPYVRMLSFSAWPELWYPLVFVSECVLAQFIFVLT